MIFIYHSFFGQGERDLDQNSIKQSSINGDVPQAFRKSTNASRCPSLRLSSSIANRFSITHSFTSASLMLFILYVHDPSVYFFNQIFRLRVRVIRSPRLSTPLLDIGLAMFIYSIVLWWVIWYFVLIPAVS